MSNVSLKIHNTVAKLPSLNMSVVIINNFSHYFCQKNTNFPSRTHFPALDEQLDDITI